MPYRQIDNLLIWADRLDWHDYVLLGACASLLALLYLTVTRLNR